MISYIGDTRSRRILDIARSMGWGQIIQRGRLSGRRLDLWSLDNGAYEDWKAGRAFDAEQFAADLEAICTSSCRPRFVVCPDIVAGGAASLELSLSWRERCQAVAPTYLAVQDGMPEDDVAAVLCLFDGLFVGGTLSWKLATGASWIRLAHRYGLPCHVGRVGTARRVAWAIASGADSIDSCLPLWSSEKLAAFRGALSQSQFGFEEP